MHTSSEYLSTISQDFHCFTVTDPCVHVESILEIPWTIYSKVYKYIRGEDPALSVFTGNVNFNGTQEEVADKPETTSVL